jgi:hypothetical protein
MQGDPILELKTKSCHRDGEPVGCGSSSKWSKFWAMATFSSFMENCFSMQFLGHVLTVKWEGASRDSELHRDRHLSSSWEHFPYRSPAPVPQALVHTLLTFDKVSLSSKASPFPYLCTRKHEISGRTKPVLQGTESNHVNCLDIVTGLFTVQTTF